MDVTILYDNFQTGLREFTYPSKYKRINAKGIKEEAKNILVENLGRRARHYEIVKLIRY